MSKIELLSLVEKQETLERTPTLNHSVQEPHSLDGTAGFL
jgi:hypothetical protein